MERANTILIVDDDGAEREILEGLFLGQGYQLGFASNGADGLSQATSDLQCRVAKVEREVRRRRRSERHRVVGAQAVQGSVAGPAIERK